ncbi:hypothetical protein [Halobacterium wangiae]|uniref:hypothetical protein n=1 Tax=Halobacterium wangiae TaxID=2902623 RepID=UPI001E4AEB0C|nr:hypothetical protein [Halobacterium wangiae]
MHELFRYSDSIGRLVRVGFTDDADAWIRQERRRGKWCTMESHPMESLESVQGEPLPEDHNTPVTVNTGP